MKRLLLFVFFLIISSCALKNTQQSLQSGDYDTAIDRAVYALSKNKEKKGNQEYVYILEDAYARAVDRDLRQADLLAKDANPRNLEALFNTYLQLYNRQEKVRPLLPLTKAADQTQAQFAFADYSDQVVSSKNALSKYLYDNCKALLATSDKDNYRRAFEDLTYLNQISPGFKDVPQLIQLAKEKGSDYVRLIARNETRILIPLQLERELLEMGTSGLNDKWTVYHNIPQPGRNYDFEISLNFREINISPEQLNQSHKRYQKEIKTGQRKKTVRGHVVRDSLGRPVMEDVFKMVRAEVFEYEQFKASQVTAKVEYFDLKTNQLMQAFPLSSEFVFSNRYARYKGDSRAIDSDCFPLFDNRPIPFPSNEQMVFDTGTDLKNKFRNILSRNRLRS